MHQLATRFLPREMITGVLAKECKCVAVDEFLNQTTAIDAWQPYSVAITAIGTLIT